MRDINEKLMAFVDKEPKDFVSSLCILLRISFIKVLKTTMVSHTIEEPLYYNYLALIQYLKEVTKWIFFCQPKIDTLNNSSITQALNPSVVFPLFWQPTRIHN